MFYTYAHYKPNDVVFYIGKGQGKRAFSLAYRNKHHTNIVLKHGKPKIEILSHWKTESEAFEHEKFLIECFKDLGFKLANKTNGGEGASGVVVSEETRLKMRNSHLNQKRTPEQCERIRLAIAGKPRPNARKPKSEEHKKAISKALTGRKREKFSDEWRENMSKALRERHAKRKQLKGE